MDNDIDVFEPEAPSYNGGFDDIDTRDGGNYGGYYGGDEAEPADYSGHKKNEHWHLALIIAIIVALILIYYREQFTLPLPTAISNLPYTSGANLRMFSVDSSTNRGGV